MVFLEIFKYIDLFVIIVYILSMLIHKKVKYYRKKVVKITMQELCRRIKNIYKDTAISTHTLSRLENGYGHAIRLKWLSQIATGLDITLQELLEGTEFELSKVVSTIPRKERGSFTYNEKAISLLYSFRTLPYQASEVIIKPKGKTDLEQDPQTESEDQERYKKCIIVLKGSITVRVGKEKHILKKGDSTVFDSDNPHFFQNTTNHETSFLVIRSPKRF